MNIGTPGYRSPEQDKMAKQLQRDIPVPHGHWFLDEHDYDTKNEKYQNHKVDPYGFHTNDCNGIHIKENSLLGYSICCGKTYCSICEQTKIPSLQFEKFDYTHTHLLIKN